MSVISWQLVTTPQRVAAYFRAMRCSSSEKSATASPTMKGWMSYMKASTAVIMQPMCA